MRTLNKFFYVVAMGLLAVATTSFGEGYYNPYSMNHGGYAPSMYQNPYSRPVAPNYYGGMGMGGSGTIANGGGGMMGGMGMNTGFNPYMNQSSMYGNMYGMNNMMFNPYLQPYLNSAPWGQYGYNQNQWNNPWTGTWNNGFGNTMMNPYWGSSFQSPYGYNNYNNYGMYGQPNSWMYNNGIPGLGYNLNGLGTNDFYDWGLNGYGYGNGGYSPYLGYTGMGYDNYGLGLGYGNNYYSPYDYSYSGYGGGYYGGYGDVGYYDGMGGFGDYWGY